MPLTLISIFFISLVPILVGLVAQKTRSFNKNAVSFLVNFAAGVMLGNTFFELLPESITGSGAPSILNVTLLGIVSFFLLEKYFLWHCHTFDTHSHKSTAMLVMVGDTLHNFIDGIVIAGAYFVSPFVGLSTSAAIILHEIPQEIADFSVLISEGIKARKAVVFNYSSGLVAIVGGLMGYLFLNTTQYLVPYFTAFAAGMFIYISSSDLIPRSHDTDRKRFDYKTALSFIMGISSIGILTLILN